METTSKRYIDVTNETKNKLARLFKCTETMVYMALTYRKSSSLAKRYGMLPCVIIRGSLCTIALSVKPCII